MQRLIVCCGAALFCAMLLLIAGCSSGGGNALSIKTSSGSVTPDGSITLYASKAVTWSIEESNGGSITSAGVYTAPAFSGSYHVQATTVATPAQQAVYAVTVSAQPAANTFVAGPMADAAYESQPDGANLVLWPGMGSRVIAYIIYRDTNLTAPVAVVSGSTTSYVDSATPLSAGNMLESTVWNIAIDPNLGIVTQFSPTITDATSLAQLENASETLSYTTFTITAQRVPLSAGQACGYQICTLYIEYQQNGLNGGTELPSNYQLYLGNKSAVSTRPTLTAPPTPTAPANSTAPSNGVYSCQTVPSATSYALQVSPDATFPAGDTYSMLATIVSTSTAQATLSQSDLESAFPTAAGHTIYWRMGARVDISILPFALSMPNTDGWVFSPLQTYTLPSAPPSSPKKRNSGLSSRGA